MGKQQNRSKSVTFCLMLEILYLSALQKVFKVFIKPGKGRLKKDIKIKIPFGVALY